MNLIFKILILLPLILFIPEAKLNREFNSNYRILNFESIAPGIIKTETAPELKLPKTSFDFFAFNQPYHLASHSFIIVDFENYSLNAYALEQATHFARDPPSDS